MGKKIINRQNWLLSTRFVLDPFQSGAFFAETDTLLDMPNMPSYIDKENIEMLIGDINQPGPCYIFAKTGCGKSSLRKRIRHEYETHNLISHKQKLLIIDYVNHNYSSDEAEFEHHLSRILSLAEIAMPADLQDLKLVVQKSPELALNEFSKICKSKGLAGVYILVDNISNRESFFKIKSLMQQSFPKFNNDNFYLIKYFLPDDLFSLSQSVSLQNEFSPYLLIWSENELKQILRQRLLSCLDEYMRGDQINPIANFCDRRITEIIEDQILKLGTISSSLRTMWFFCYLLFEEYLVYSKEGKTRSQNLIDENVLRRTLLSFFSNYVLSSEINRLYKNDFYVDNSSKSLLTLSNMSPSEYKKIDRKILEILKDKKDDYSQTKIFLCYAQVDEERAKLIYLKLAESGYTPWMHCFNVLPGLDWREQRTLAVREAKNFLVILSKNSYTQEGFFLKEIRDALDIWQTKLRNIPYLIPVRLEKCKIPYDLTNFLHVDIFEDSGWDKLLMAIDIGIKRRKNDPRRKKAN